MKTKEEALAAWADWYKTFMGSKTQPMTKDVSMIFIGSMMLELQGQVQKDPELSTFFVYKLLDKRAEFCGLDISEPAKEVLCAISGNPGTVVMYLYALRYWQLTNYNKQITLAQLAEIFPIGFPTEDALHTAWDAQKVADGRGIKINLLDSLPAEAMRPVAVVG